jgi:hypothetical protein
MLNLTEKQKTIMIEVLRLGVVCGLFTINEALSNYLGHLDMFTEYSKIPELHTEVVETFATFYRGCAADPEEDIHIAKMTDIEIINYFGRMK